MPTATLERTERFGLQALNSGRTFDIALAPPLPLAATGEAAKECPILIVLDSSLTFGTAMERSSLYSAMGLLESAVIVGVGYPGSLLASIKARTVDFTPPTPTGVHAEMQPMIGSEFGGADAFLSFLLDELAPEVRRRVPEASASRISLHGFSLGGLFSAYALLARPEAFETVSIIAPSLWWNDFAILKELDAFKDRLADTGATPRVLIGVGAREQDVPQSAPPELELKDLQETVRKARMVDAAREFAETLSGVLPDVEFALFDREDHTGALTAGTGRAVSFALSRRA